MKNKICTKCRIKKDIANFTKDRARKDRLYPYCKECLHLFQKASYKRHRKNRLKCTAEYHNNNKEKVSKRRKNHRRTFPWKYTLQYIKTRCNNTKKDNYKYYGGRGIKCLINEEELKTLWFRDKAHEMNKPSIDRKENDGNYTFDNCRYIELGKNSIECNKRQVKKILQYNLEGNFIKEWESIKNAGETLGLHKTNITRCAKGKLKTTGGFVWRYKI